MKTMGCYISNLHADEMFFQYQGDILNIDQIGGWPVEREKIQLDALPFHLQVMWDERDIIMSCVTGRTGLTHNF